MVEEQELKRGRRLIEIPLPGTQDVIRQFVDDDTEEEDLPEGARMMSRAETKGFLSKATAPEVIRVGDRVMRRPATGLTDSQLADQGYVDAQLKRETKPGSGVKMVRVKWERSNSSSRENPETLKKIW